MAGTGNRAPESAARSSISIATPSNGLYLHNPAHKSHLGERHLHAPPLARPSPRPPGPSRGGGGTASPKKKPNNKFVPVFPQKTAATPSRGSGGKAHFGGTPSVPRISSGGRHLPSGGAARPQQDLRRLWGSGGARPAGGGGGSVCPFPTRWKGTEGFPPGRSGVVSAGPRRLFPPRPGGVGKG